MQMTASGGEAGGKPGVAGVYTNQRLNLSKLWEGLRKTCQGFKPDSGNLTVRDYRGASENVRHGETVNPPAIERAGAVTPHLQRGASDFYPSGGNCFHLLPIPLLPQMADFLLLRKRHKRIQSLALLPLRRFHLFRYFHRGRR